jgi:hypothetical protein
MAASGDPITTKDRKFCYMSTTFFVGEFGPSMGFLRHHTDASSPQQESPVLTSDLSTMFKKSLGLCKMPERRVSFREDLVSEVALVERPDEVELRDLYYHSADFRRFRCECKVEDLARASSIKDVVSASQPRQRKLYQAPSRTVYRPPRRRRRSTTKV